MIYLLLHFNYLFLLLDFKAVFTQYLADTFFLYKCLCKFRIFIRFISFFVAIICCILSASEQVLYPDIWRYTNKSYYYYYHPSHERYTVSNVESQIFTPNIPMPGPGLRTQNYGM